MKYRVLIERDEDLATLGAHVPEQRAFDELRVGLAFVGPPRGADWPTLARLRRIMMSSRFARMASGSSPPDGGVPEKSHTVGRSG